MTKIAIRRALVSVYDKTGLDELARGLHEAGVEIVSTGSTAALIRDLGRAGHAGRGRHRLPGDPRRPGQDAAPARARRAARRPERPGARRDDRGARHRAVPAARRRTCTRSPPRSRAAPGRPEVVEQIDIGGPAMVRASAKNHGSVAVVTDPAHYPDVLAAVRAGGFDLAARQRLALAAFRHTAAYDIAVASWLGSIVAPDDEVAGSQRLPGLDRRELRAGRGAALRREPAPARRALRQPGPARRHRARRAAAPARR